MVNVDAVTKCCYRDVTERLSDSHVRLFTIRFRKRLAPAKAINIPRWDAAALAARIYTSDSISGASHFQKMLRRTHKTVEWHFEWLGRKFILISSQLYGKSEPVGRPDGMYGRDRLAQFFSSINFQGNRLSRASIFFWIFQMNLDFAYKLLPILFARAATFLYKRIGRVRRAFLPCRSCHGPWWSPAAWPIGEGIRRPGLDRLDVARCRGISPNTPRPNGRDGVAWNWWSAGIPATDWRTIPLVCPPGWPEILRDLFRFCTKWLTIPADDLR